MRPSTVNDARFLTLIDDDGNPPHQENCAAVCRLFDRQQPDESRQAWLARITSAARLAPDTVLGRMDGGGM